MNDDDSFGHWLRQRRRALDLTQTALARQVGCAPVTIRKLEGDELRPSKQLAELLADHLGIAPEEREGFLLFARSGRQVERRRNGPPRLLETPNQVPWRELAPRRTNLPNPLTSFVGRARERVEVKQLLTTTRLLTLTGPGGIGKTRLASHVAGELLDSFRDGVWLVELAALTEPSSVLQAVATVMGVREEGGRSLQSTLLDSMRSKQLLLVLDNCEHLILACAQLAETMLRACSNLTVLATSREALAITGETSFAVPPLALPHVPASATEGHDISLDLLAPPEAVHLFVDRAQAVQPAFTLTHGNAPVVARICQRLDGIPLAIELAAARLKTLAVEQIEARLDDRFNLLKAGSRTALPRHQTLQATIDWSYELLSKPERTMLCRLAVFAGGWTLEAAEAICADGDGQAGIFSRHPRLRAKRGMVLDLLSNLVDKSLVVGEIIGTEKRYHLLETIRQYAREKLVESKELEQVRVRHFDWFLQLAERGEGELQGPNQIMWLDRLELEYDNLLGALDWSMLTSELPQSSPPRMERGLELAAALWWFWRVRGSRREGRERLTAILSHPEAEHKSLIRAKALYGVGALAFAQGDYESAQASYNESLAISRPAGGKREMVLALNGLGAIAQRQGNYARSQSLFDEALGLSRETGFQWGVASSLLNLGSLRLDQSDYDLAHSLLEDGLAIFRQLGDKGGIALSLMNLGLIPYYQGDYRRASTLYEESLTFYRELRDMARVAIIIDSLAYIELHEGNYEKAWGLFIESLGYFREFRNIRLLVDVLEGLAGLAAAERRPAEAARLFGAAQARLAEIGAQLESGNRDEHERNVSVARAQLNEAAFTVAWKEGRELSVEKAIQYVLAMHHDSAEMFDTMTGRTG